MKSCVGVPKSALDAILGSIALSYQTSQVYKVINNLNRLIIYGDACISIGVDGHHFGFGGIDYEACL